MRQRFLYYLPGLGGCSEQMLQSLGLYDRFVGANGKLGAWSVRAWEGGPDGARGCIVALGSRPPEFDAERQSWLCVEVPEKKPPVYFCGIENIGTPPGPEDLQLPVSIDGYGVVLGDGRSWRVPLIWRWNVKACEHESALPKRLIRRVVDGRPRMVSETMPAFVGLEAIAARVWDSYLNETPIGIDQLFDDALALLATGYRIGAAEVQLLGLFNEAVLRSVVSAAIDVPAIREQAMEGMTRGLIRVPEVEDRDEMASSLKAMEVKHG